MRIAAVLPYDSRWIDAAALGLLAVVFLVAWVYRNRPRTVRPDYDPPAHVKVTGTSRRCSRCHKIRVCHDLAEGWGHYAITVPYCSPCVRDVLDVPHGQGEAHA